jgi:GrpB-like predicted nucleotidyltransferase (UPF0157 family)
MSGVRIVLEPPDPEWPSRFEQVAAEIRGALGDRIRLLAHVGSTSVPGLAAKPIIDLALEHSADEASCAPAILDLGYDLRVREPDWFEHRVLRGPNDDVNLHVFTNGASEIDRVIRFRDRLRSNGTERRRYELAKKLLAARKWDSV